MARRESHFDSPYRSRCVARDANPLPDQDAWRKILTHVATLHSQPLVAPQSHEDGRPINELETATERNHRHIRRRRPAPQRCKQTPTAAVCGVKSHNHREMPRRGDEANRLGNEYEGLWIADSLLDVLAGDAASITIAAFGEEGQGIDLIKQTKDGFR